MTSDEFTEIMAYLSRGVGKTFPADQAEVYYDLLHDLPADALRLAARRALLESQYPTIPPVGTLRKLATEALTASEGWPSPMEAWELVRHAISRYGYMREAQGLASLPRLVRRATEALGWQDICNREGPGVIRAQFRGAYEIILAREQRTALLPEEVKETLAELSAVFALPAVEDRRRLNDSVANVFKTMKPK